MNGLLSRVALAAAVALAAPPVQAGMLYKSVSVNGTIVFSDSPPSDDARILEQRPISLDSERAGSPASAGIDLAASLIEPDAALARANVLVDLAEHALALARRDTWTHRDGLKLASRRASRTDGERIEFYKRNVLAARKSLMELLRDRMVAFR